MNIEWENPKKLQSKTYTCGHCGKLLACERGYEGLQAFPGGPGQPTFLYICHACKQPTYFGFDDIGRPVQVPGSPFGQEVKQLPAEVKDLYAEARNCMRGNACTAAVLCCRKLLMHVGVQQDAEEDRSFAYYVDYLDQEHLTPRGSKDWVSYIKDKGNEANHEINMVSRKDAEQVIEFVEMMLRLIYEFPGRMKGTAGGP